MWGYGGMGVDLLKAALSIYSHRSAVFIFVGSFHFFKIIYNKLRRRITFTCIYERMYKMVLQSKHGNLSIKQHVHSIN